MSQGEPDEAANADPAFDESEALSVFDRESTPEVPPEVLLQYEALVDKGVEAGEARRFGDAIKFLEEAVGLGVSDPEADYNLGVVWGIVAMEDLKISDFYEDHLEDEILIEKAIFQFQRALAHDPDYYHAYNNMGTMYALDGQNDHAVEALRCSLAIYPDQPDVQEELDDLLSP